MNYFTACYIVLAPLVLMTASCTSQASQFSITLPTENKHLETGKYEQFYTYVHRNFEGQVSKPWTAGKYGFVRTKKRTEDGVICTKFHEGIDITPLRRDSSGKPLDPVNAISNGVVAYANPVAGHSNYGKYVVLEHRWECGPIYSLYAHLADTSVKAGQGIPQGQKLGTLGYTGVGLDKSRAHLHLELNLLLSTRFQTWYNKYYPSKNYHGNHSGINMVGLDFAEFYMAKKKKPSLTLPAFVKTMDIHYKVTVPRKNELEILARYPWLAASDVKQSSPSWELSLSSSGFPISISLSNRQVSQPIITYIRPCQSKHEYHTKKFVTGTGSRASLTQTGSRYIELLTGDF